MNILHCCDFTNELGHKITIAVSENKNGITITADGPTSSVRNTYTRKEASVLVGLLASINVKPDRKIKRSIKK